MKILKLFAKIIILAVLSLLTIFFYFAKDLPRPERFTERTELYPIEIYDRTGENLLYSVGIENKIYVSLDKIPKKLILAVLTAEDKNFYNHFGIDLKAILRSLWLNFQKKELLYGGSTITQQLIRSTFLTPEKSIKRKIREIVLALELERRYSKEQILEWYLNQVPLGFNVYGVGAGAKFYFAKEVEDLSLAESATLASLIKAPSFLAKNLKSLKERRDKILAQMFKEGLISKEEFKSAIKTEIKFKFATKKKILAPHFVFFVLDQIKRKYGEEFARERGFKVRTTLNLQLQKLGEEIVKKWAKRNEIYKAYNAALVAVNPKNGDILVMVGSKDWFGKSYPEGCIPGKNCLFEPKFNVAVAKPGRQPGSAFKPIVYAKAFEKGYSDKTIVLDTLTNFGIWGGKPYIPQNYDGRFRGPVTLRQALAQSLNVPSVKVLLYLAGLKESIDLAKEMGITTLTKPYSFYGPSIVLGGGEVNLLDMIQVYSVFSQDGVKIPLRAILEIKDHKGNIIYRAKTSIGKRVISQKTAKLITDILSDNLARAGAFGLNSPLYVPEIPEKVAVKTGTTNEFRDAWTIGYTQNLVVGVWTGNNDNSPTLRAPGVLISAPIWKEFLIKAYYNLTNSEL